MKTSIAIIIIAIVAIVVGGGIWWWAGTYNEDTTQNGAVVNKSTSVANDNEANINEANENTVSDTTGWETYTNEDLGFEIAMPPGVKVDLEMNEERNRRTTFEGEDLSYEVWVRADDPEHPTELANYYLLDFVPLEETTINGKVANYYEAEHGYCDAGMCGSPFTAYALKNNNDFYIVSFYDDTEMSEEEEKVISSFRFLN